MYTFTSYNLPPYEPRKPRKAARPSSASRIGAALAAPFINFGKYFCTNTSIHGFNHIAAPRRHWFERVLWTIATGLAVWGAVDVALGQLNRYYENPTVVTLEKDFRTWQYSLPGMTGCLADRVDPEKAKQVIKDLWDVDPTDDKYEYYIKFLKVVANSDLLHLDGYAEFVGDEDLNVDLKDLVVDVFPDMDLKLPHSTAVYKWTTVMSEFGVCQTTNSILIADIALEKVNTNYTKFYPVKCSYAGSGCFVMINSNEEVNFYVHSSYDIADVSIQNYTLFPKKSLIVDLLVFETGSAKGVKELSRTRRGCYYSDEPDIKGRKVYSTNTCRQHCRSRIAMQLCGCIPFYYFYDVGPQCTVSGMACLAQHSLQLASIKGVSCNCVAQCTVSIYRIASSSSELLPSSAFQTAGGLKFTVLAPRTRYTREIMFHFQDLIVSFGGAAGLFLGASFISLVEIIYFMFEKLYYNITTTTKEPKEKHAKDVKESMLYEAIRVQELTKMLEDNHFEYGNVNRYYY